jgi:hypothetical protein
MHIAQIDLISCSGDAIFAQKTKYMPMKITERRKKYKIRNKMIAKWAKYASANAFNNSSAKDRILSLVEGIIKHIEDQLVRTYSPPEQ